MSLAVLEKCLRCDRQAHSWGKQFCHTCEFNHAVEVADGLYLLGRYLRGWAAFREWERTH